MNERRERPRHSVANRIATFEGIVIRFPIPDLQEIERSGEAGDLFFSRWYWPTGRERFAIAISPAKVNVIALEPPRG